MTEAIGLTIYNPGALSDEDFLRGFVARQKPAKALTDSLADVVAGRLVSHFLILGQRGMGKTSLLRRLALAAKTDDRLKDALIPLTFREEQYNVHSYEVFWLNCLDALGDWYDREGNHVRAEQLDREVATLSGRDGSQELFNKWVSLENRRPLLLLDNIDLIFNGLKKEPGYLQQFIPKPGGLLIVGGAATPANVICEPDGDLHSAFQVTKLERLSREELIACLQRLALARGPEGEKVLQLLATETPRIRTLHDLTGGNPRTLTMLYMLLATDVHGDVFTDLERLLDQATVLYKARVEDLSSQARVVLDAVALAWDPVLSSSVAHTARLDVTIVSSQLDRLLKEGIVEKVPVSTTTKTAFQVSERFFNIWYLMRHGARRQRSRLRWLTVFLKSFYSDVQLIARAKSLVNSDTDLAVNQGFDAGQYLLALSDAINDPGWRSVLTSQAREEFERYAHSLGRKLSEIVDPSDVPLPANSAEWVLHGNLLRQHLKRPKEAANAFKKATELDPKNWAAWFNLGATQLGALGESPRAIQAFKHALALNKKHLPTQYLLADAYLAAGEVASAKAAYLACLKINPGYYLALIALGDVYSEEGNVSAASDHYERASKLAPETDTEALHASGFFAGYVLEDFERARKLYQRLVDLDQSDYVALTNLGVLKMVLESVPQVTPMAEEVLQKHPDAGKALIRTFEALKVGDRSTALSYVPQIFEYDLVFEKYKGFILLLLRRAKREGWADLLLRLLDETGATEKNWPLRAGYDAYLFGRERLLDVNPEVRPAAEKIFSLLAAPEAYRLTKA